jgi:MerR family transcriptional regulator, light-induced transcriptional regulator
MALIDDAPLAEQLGAPGYSIRVTSRLTGISADTLRMWERRYGFPKPQRNEAGVRVYSDDDVERLILVSRALKAGYRAGEVILKSPNELKQILTNSARSRVEAMTAPPSVRSLMSTLLADDAVALRMELRQCVATLGPRRFLIEVAGPLVEEVGEAWARGQLEVRHEHLISETLSTQLRLLLSAYEGNTSGPIILLTTLSQEAHGLGLEMVSLYVAIAGLEPRLLGVDTPPDQIVEAARALRARIVGISISASADLDTTAAHLRYILSELPPSSEIWLGGKRARDVNVQDPRLHFTPTWADLDQQLLRVLG